MHIKIRIEIQGGRIPSTVNNRIAFVALTFTVADLTSRWAPTCKREYM